MNDWIRTSPGPIASPSVGENDQNNRWRVFGFRDPQVRSLPGTVRLRTVDRGLQSAGDDFGLGIVDRLNADASLHGSIPHVLEIQSEGAGWRMTVRPWRNLGGWC